MKEMIVSGPCLKPRSAQSTRRKFFLFVFSIIPYETGKTVRQIAEEEKIVSDDVLHKLFGDNAEE